MDADEAVPSSRRREEDAEAGDGEDTDGPGSCLPDRKPQQKPRGKMSRSRENLERKADGYSGNKNKKRLRMAQRRRQFKRNLQ